MVIDEGGGGGVMATCSDCRDGLNSSGDPLSCWELVLGEAKWRGRWWGVRDRDLDWVWGGTKQ